MQAAGAGRHEAVTGPGYTAIMAPEARPWQLAYRAEYDAALLRAQLETSVFGILCVDEEGRIVYFNRRFAELWRIPPRVLARRSDREALDAVLANLEDPAAFLSKVRRLYSSRREQSYDEVLLRDGRVFERYSRPVIGVGGRFFGRVWYFRDITRRKLADRVSELRLERLIRLNASLDALVSALSEEMSLPLRKISFFSGLLERRYGEWLSPAARSLVSELRRSSEQVTEFVSDMLMLARVGGRWHEENRSRLVGIVSEALGEARRRHPEARIRARIGPLPVVAVHPAVADQLFAPLIDNAIAARKSDSVDIEVSSSLRPDGWAEVTVSDDGIGFDPAMKERIFEPFFRQPGFGGPGLGLALSRRIIRGLGGRITAEGRPGRGAAVTIAFPPGALLARSA